MFCGRRSSCEHGEELLSVSAGRRFTVSSDNSQFASHFSFGFLLFVWFWALCCLPGVCLFCLVCWCVLFVAVFVCLGLLFGVALVDPSIETRSISCEHKTQVAGTCTL